MEHERTIPKASPFYSPAFLRRLQKMIRTPRGRPSDVELAIERTIQEIPGARLEPRPDTAKPGTR